MNSLYPMFLDIRDRKCLVVGGGEAAAHKVQGLLRSGAAVVVVAGEPGKEIQFYAERGKLTLAKRTFKSADIEGIFLAIAASTRPEENDAVAAACKKADIPCAIIDKPEASTFHVPSVVTRGELKIAVSTGGKSPGMAARIRREIEKKYNDRYDQALLSLGALRRRIRQEGTTDAQETIARMHEATTSDAMADFLDGRRSDIDG